MRRSLAISRQLEITPFLGSYKVHPFVIRLKDRFLADLVLQPLVLKLDPESKTTGMTIARVEESAEGEMNRAFLFAKVVHRGDREVSTPVE